MKSCSSIPGVAVYSYEDEEKMLEDWGKYVLACDPDIITGYNIQNFDIDYLMKRAKTLKVSTFPLLGRIKGELAKSQTSTFSSSRAASFSAFLVAFLAFLALSSSLI